MEHPSTIMSIKSNLTQWISLQKQVETLALAESGIIE